MSIVKELAAKAKVASRELALLTAKDKNQALLSVADMILANTAEIIKANEIDLKNGAASGLSPALLDRLALNKDRISDMVEGVKQVSELEDPVGEIIASWDSQTA
ncbi:hypothetical protein N752_02240 [Desulforamulus aquiferis]|nr:hypothetical protein N752_02240 [Desulforamulus aquiferis]